MQNSVFTVGHSTHSQEYFISLLQRHRITALCDVRSMPYSRMNPQFNRENLKKVLQKLGIQYVFLGKELGARSEDPLCYVLGKIQYDRLAQTALFQCGLKRVQEGMKQFSLALMCVEKEPLECHRTILVARYLVALGLEVQHIHADGRLEKHTDALNRLARILNMREEQHMFCSHEEMLADAYHLQEERIAYNSEVDTAVIRAVAG